MSAGACIAALEGGGQLDADRAAAARALYEERLAEYAATGSRESAEALASKDLLEALERNVTRKEFLAGRTIKVRERIAGDLERYQGGGGNDGPIDPRAGAGLFDHDPRAPYSNVEGRRLAVRGAAHRLLDKVMADHSANLLGKVRGRAQLKNITRELFGEATGDVDAKAMAEAWRRAAEMLRQRFNAAGGDIGFRSDWGLPQMHDWKAVRAAGFEQWAAFIRPRLDPARMTDQLTGKPISPDKLDELLRPIWDDIRSQGAVTRTPGSGGAGKALANRRGDARFFVFRDAAAWDEYAEKFGGGGAYDAMMGHIDAMARDIAALEVLGPNPEDTVRWVKETITGSAQRDIDPGSKAVSRAKSAGKKIDDLWHEYAGRNIEPRNETLALVFSSYRALNVARMLGGAFLSTTSDFAFSASRRAFNGLNSKLGMGRYLKLMAPGSLEDQKLAVRRGLIADEWSSRTAGQSRYLMEEMQSEWARRLAEGVLRVSLLSRATQAQRWAYGMETLATYTEAATRSYDTLHKRQRDALARYGIGAGDWDKLRTAPMDTDRGVQWISPHNLDNPELASRFIEMVLEETNLAVPVADLATRAFMNSKLERGTVIGELGRSAMQFKSFGVSVLINQSREIMAMNMRDAIGYGLGMVIGTTAAGALAMQLKAVAAGRDPRPMDDDEFWSAAMLQGGGFGIFGDFLFADMSRYGGGFAQTMAGPIASDVQDIYNLANAPDPRRQAVRTAKGLIPGNNIWYARLALDRMLADRIEQWANPGFPDAVRRMQRQAAEQGTSFWWRPGQGMPASTPDFANAFEEGPPE